MEGLPIFLAGEKLSVKCLSHQTRESEPMNTIKTPNPRTYMHLLKVCATAGVAFAAALQLNAQVLWSDNFSSYNNGDLDANESGGPNQAPNGGPGNPWWGPLPGNLVVGSSFNGITPYPGSTKLAGANVAGNYSVEYNNIGYRLNGGNNFLGNVAVSWAFYDPAGAGKNAAQYNDIVSLDGFQSPDGWTTTADWTTATVTSPSTTLLTGHYTSGDQWMFLGADNVAGFNSGVYQARVIGATTANQGASVANGSGWFNLNVARTVGWHTAAIVLGSPNGANTTVSMFIDGNDVLDETLGTTLGVNGIGVYGSWSDTLAGGAFDNFAVTVPEPGTVSLLVCGGLACLTLRRRSRK